MQKPRYISLISGHTITQSELCLPIQYEGQTVGILDIQSPYRDSFQENDIIAISRKQILLSNHLRCQSKFFQR